MSHRSPERPDRGLSPGFRLTFWNRWPGQMERLDLTDGPTVEPKASRSNAQRERAREAHLLIERHARIRSAIHPGNLDAPLLLREITVGLDGIVVAAIVRGKWSGLRREVFSIEISDEIAAVRAGEHPGRVPVVPASFVSGISKKSGHSLLPAVRASGSASTPSGSARSRARTPPCRDRAP